MNLPINERINLILSEFAMSSQWQRACISLAIYRSEITKDHVITEVQRAMVSKGKEIVYLDVNKKFFDLPVIIRDYPNAENKIFSISGLRWGGGRGYSNAYRAINMHREYLVEGRALSIFWLTPKEARQAARFAPDFWAFRHIVVEFLDLPLVSEFTSADVDFEKSNETIDACLAILGKDPRELGALREIAKQYFALKCYEDAAIYFRKALRLNTDDAELWSSLAEVYKSMKRPAAAARIIKKYKQI